jgi:serine/threonine protein kinase/WD40 repeat protein
VEPAEATAPTPEPAPGTLIAGRYKLLERIGEGGMGEVWMAEQREPIQRKVALKIIKAGMDTRQVVARFEAERQALALMDHPNIAKVFDAAATDSGRPFFVMELVKGTPITTYCDQHRLTLRERLELFLPVCQAIQHAHQKGIIHRDVKPSNILIAPYDGKPVPKIIDFGIAKAIGQRLTERTLYTGFGAVVGTLEYMSPEQAELNNQDIDTRSDIYTLGVLLFELLTGTTPIGHERLTQAAFTEMLRAIREDEPPKPSRRLSDSKESQVWIAEQRQTDQETLARTLRRDLDWIVIKALAKDRTRRYQTTGEFVRDIEHFLHNEPVEARPPSLLDRSAKWCRRHRPAVWAGAAVLGVTLILLTVAVVFLTVANARTRRALSARDQARIDLRDQHIKTLAAERDKTWGLALAHWKEARIARSARQPGQRWRSLEALAAALQELRSLGQFEANRAELRDDAIASITLWDVRPVKHLSGTPGLPSPEVDALGRHYAFVDAPNLISWRRLADDRVIRRWQLEGGIFVGLDVSPDGRYIWGDCHDGQRGEKPVARVWDTASGELVLQHPIHTGAHAFRPDCRVLALEKADESIALCDLSTGRELTPLPARLRPATLRFHPSGQYFAVSFDAPPEVEVWDMAAGKAVLRLPGARYAGATLAWSPDGSILAVGSNDFGIYLCTFPGGKVQAMLRGHEHVVTRMEYHPSGRLLASTSHDDTTRLWCFSPGEELVLPGERLLGFSRDGRRLITTPREDVTVWELVDPLDCVRYMPYGEGPTRGPWGIVFAPDNRLLASASMDGVLLWDAAAAHLIGRVPSGAGRVLALSSDGNELYTSGPGRVMRWPIVRERGGRAVRVGPGTVLRSATATGRSPNFAVAGTGQSLLLGAGDGGVDLVPLAEPDKVRRLGIHLGLTTVALSPDGHWAASTGHPDDSVSVWDVARATLVRRIPHRSEYCGATFSPDGRTLVTGDRSNFCFREFGSWALKASLPRSPRSLFSLVAFTRDGRLLALGQDRNQIELYNAATLRRLATLAMPAGPASLTGLSLSPDGIRLAATTDYNVVVLWDLRRLRQGLAALDLDWEMPPYPPSGRDAEPAEALTAEVLSAAQSPR